MTVLINNFAGGTSGATITAGSTSGGVSGNPFDFVGIGTGSSVVYDNSEAIHVGLSCKLTSGSSSSSAYVAYQASFGSQSIAYWRCYFYVTFYPSVGMRLFNSTASGGSAYTVSLNTVGKLAVTYGTAGTNYVVFSTAVPLSQWFRVEGFGIASATVGQVSASLFNTPDSPTVTETHTSAATLNTAASNPTSYNYGDSNGLANVGPFWIANVGLSSVTYLGPAISPSGMSGLMGVG